MTTSAPIGAKKVSIEFRPHDKVTRVPPGMTIFNAANWIGLPIDSTCGAKGTCGQMQGPNPARQQRGHRGRPQDLH